MGNVGQRRSGAAESFCDAVVWQREVLTRESEADL
jgi:hypothetical protein